MRCSQCREREATLLGKTIWRRCYDKDRYVEKGDQIRANNRTWREQNPDYWKQPRILDAARKRAIEQYHGDSQLREFVMRRDGSCQMCKSVRQLHVHHIDGDRRHQVLENLVTLRASCHARLHRRAQVAGVTPNAIYNPKIEVQAHS